MLLMAFSTAFKKQVLLGKKRKCETGQRYLYIMIRVHFINYNCHIISQIFLTAREDGELVSLYVWEKLLLPKLVAHVQETYKLHLRH